MLFNARCRLKAILKSKNLMEKCLLTGNQLAAIAKIMIRCVRKPDLVNICYISGLIFQKVASSHHKGPTSTSYLPPWSPLAPTAGVHCWLFYPGMHRTIKGCLRLAFPPKEANTLFKNCSSKSVD